MSSYLAPLGTSAVFLHGVYYLTQTAPVGPEVLVLYMLQATETSLNVIWPW